MRWLLPSSVVCLLYSSVAALAVVAPIGCGGGEPETGTQVATPPEEIEAQNSMEDFMKTQGKKKK